MDKRLAFIGGGNIAQAILSGLVPTFEDPRAIVVADPSEEQGSQCKALGATWTQDNPAAVAGADVVLLCVKPQRARQRQLQPQRVAIQNAIVLR